MVGKGVSLKELKILFARSGNMCAFPGCNAPVVAGEGEDVAPLAEMAHIIARSDRGPRGDPNLLPEERNRASNLILLCPTHHELIDRFEHQYNVHVLREMKRAHEERVERMRLMGRDGIREGIETGCQLKRELLYSSCLPVSRLPRFVFAADTPYRKYNVQDLFAALRTQYSHSVIYAFELRNKKIYTFYDLRDPLNPLRGVYDQSTVQVLEASSLWRQPDTSRLYVTLLNRALGNYLKRKGIAYDREHRRYYFLPDKESIERKYTYRSLGGKTSTRSVVHRPITRASGKPKPYWIHLAANLSFQRVAPKQWVLTVRPERHLTKDGYECYPSEWVGRKVTRIMSWKYNWEYLQEVHLWREIVAEARPRKVIRFGKQSIVMTPLQKLYLSQHKKRADGATVGAERRSRRARGHTQKKTGPLPALCFLSSLPFLALAAPLLAYTRPGGHGAAAGC